MSQFLELPDPIFAALKEAANADGSTPAEWVAAQLQARPAANGSQTAPTADEIAHANAHLRQHVADFGAPVGCANQQIDDDLAREYGDDHAGLYRPV